MAEPLRSRQGCDRHASPGSRPSPRQRSPVRRGRRPACGGRGYRDCPVPTVGHVRRPHDRGPVGEPSRAARSPAWSWSASTPPVMPTQPGSEPANASPREPGPPASRCYPSTPSRGDFNDDLTADGPAACGRRCAPRSPRRIWPASRRICPNELGAPRPKLHAAQLLRCHRIARNFSEQYRRLILRTQNTIPSLIENVTGITFCKACLPEFCRNRNYSPHMTRTAHAPAGPAAGVARASRMAVRALRPLRRPVSTMEQRAA